MSTDLGGESESFEFDLAAAIGATGGTSGQLLRLYLPNKDKNNQEFGCQRKWVLEAARLLAQIGSGVTIYPAAEGLWPNLEEGFDVWESTVLVYTYVIPEKLQQHFGELRALLHRFGRETHQGEVVMEFDGLFYRITEYDGPEGG